MQWWSLTAIVAAASDVTYFVSAWMFNALWHEQPRGGGTGLARRILSYGILWTVLLVFLDAGGDNDDDDVPNPTRSCWWGILGFVLTGCGTVWGWRDTRQYLVQGGPYDPEPTPGRPPVQQQQQQKQVIVVTGANTGIGKETVQQLAGIVSNEQSTILLLCRSVQKGQAAIQEIQSTILQRQQRGRRRQNPGKKMESRCIPQLRVIACDLSSYASVRKAVTEIVTHYKTIHVLINNAGVMLKDLTYTMDGHETMLQANYLGHFLLTALLLPHFSSDGGRIINVSSSTYAMALRDFPIHQLDDLQFRRPTNSNNNTGNPKGPSSSSPRPFSLFSQYAATKWCNILHAMALQDKLLLSSSASRGWFVAAVHPGLVRTDVVRNMPAHLYYPNRIFAVFLALLQKTPPQGAWCSVYTAVTPSLPSGKYWVNRQPQALVSLLPQHNNNNNNKNTTSVAPAGRDLSEQAEKLWHWSCRQVKLSEEERKALLPTRSRKNHGAKANR